MTRMRVPAWGAAVFVALLTVHLVDVSARETALARFLSDDAEAIERIVADYGVGPEQCASRQDADLRALAAAFVTIESFATSRFEGWLRAAVTYGGTLAGLTPDISTGPGRIRMSTARAAADGPAPSNSALASTLLTACGAAEIAGRMLASRRPPDGAPTPIDRRFIEAAAAAYNGQAWPASSLQAALSARVYVDLVYAANQHYRFAALAAGERRLAGR